MSTQFLHLKFEIQAGVAHSQGMLVNVTSGFPLGLEECCRVLLLECVGACRVNVQCSKSDCGTGSVGGGGKGMSEREKRKEHGASRQKPFYLVEMGSLSVLLLKSCFLQSSETLCFAVRLPVAYLQHLPAESNGK